MQYFWQSNTIEFWHNKVHSVLKTSRTPQDFSYQSKVLLTTGCPKAVTLFYININIFFCPCFFPSLYSAVNQHSKNSTVDIS